MTFDQGYCNGYSHRYEAWRTLLASPVISHGNIHLMVEITARIDPGVVFKLIKCKHPETIVGEIGIFANRRYVKVWDKGQGTRKVNHPHHYISVCEDEFHDVHNYLASIDSKSRSLVTAMTYVRRRMGGVSLDNQELVAPWHLEKTAALTTLVYVTVRFQDIDRIMSEAGTGSIF